MFRGFFGEWRLIGCISDEPVFLQRINLKETFFNIFKRDLLLLKHVIYF